MSSFVLERYIYIYMCKLAGCTLNVHPANLQFRPSVSGQEQFDLPHQQQDYSLRPHNPPAGNSRCLISQAQTPNEYATYMLFGYLLLNEPVMDQGRSSTLYIFMLQKPAQALAGFATLDKYRVKFFTNPSLFPCRFVTWRMLIHLVSTLESPLLLLQVRHLPIQNTTCCALVLSRLSDILELLENVTYSMLLIQNLKRFVFFFI